MSMFKSLIVDHPSHLSEQEAIINALKQENRHMQTTIRELQRELIGTEWFDRAITFKRDRQGVSDYVSCMIAAPDDFMMFEFNKVSHPVGMPCSMVIKAGDTDVMVVDFCYDHMGFQFRLTAHGRKFEGRFKEGEFKLPI